MKFRCTCLVFLFHTISSLAYRLDQDKYRDEGQLLFDPPEESHFGENDITYGNMCPLSCVCQQAHFKELPIQHWINQMQEQYVNDPNQPSTNSDDYDDLINLTTCIILPDTDIEWLLGALPADTAALNLLYTGVGQTKSMNASALVDLKQLSILEIQGAKDSYFRLVLDVPLPTIRRANFELISVVGSESLARPKSAILPKELYNYRPSLNLDTSEQSEDLPNFELSPTNIEPIPEILPYALYVEEVRRAQIPSFYGWDSLSVLRIHYCDFNKFSWETFLGLESLLHLSLEHNEIGELQPFAFSGAAQLHTLSLAHNSIELLHYRDLAGLFELQTLDLSDNGLRKLNEIMFPPLPKLKWLDLRFNPIEYIFPAAFWVMNSTEHIYFGSRRASLKLWNNAPFKMLNHLKNLQIKNISLTSLDQNMLKELTSLQSLRLHGKVNAIEFDAFSSVTRLEDLDMSNCQLREISMDAFTNCKSLRVVNLSKNALNYLPPGLFDDLPALEEIYLEQNSLRTLPAAFFTPGKATLKLIRLTDNPWECSCNMASWKAKITNQEKMPSKNRCIYDFSSGDKVSCQSKAAFQYNRKYTPRCSNFKGRSVFYVLRKHLLCPSPNASASAITNSRNPVRGLAHWQKWNFLLKTPLNAAVDDTKKQKLFQERKGMKVVPGARAKTRTNRLLWQIKNNVNVAVRRSNPSDYKSRKSSNNQDMSNQI